MTSGSAASSLTSSLAASYFLKPSNRHGGPSALLCVCVLLLVVFVISFLNASQTLRIRAALLFVQKMRVACKNLLFWLKRSKMHFHCSLPINELSSVLSRAALHCALLLLLLILMKCWRLHRTPQSALCCDCVVPSAVVVRLLLEAHWHVSGCFNDFYRRHLICWQHCCWNLKIAFLFAHLFYRNNKALLTLWPPSMHNNNQIMVTTIFTLLLYMMRYFNGVVILS